MSNFTIEQLEALKEGTTPGPWAAITDSPYISIVIADDDDQIHAPIVDIKDGATDEPEVDKNHELMAAAPELVDALIAEKQEPQIIHDVEGLSQQDPNTVIIDGQGALVTAQELIDYINGYPESAEALFPAVIIATAHQVNSAWKALGEING